MTSAEIGVATGALRLLKSGSKAIADWLDRRTERRYEEFIATALEGQVFEENADAMTPDDLFAILRALELDIEAEKTRLYGCLACAIATGRVTGDHKRHFIRALHELSAAQVQQLRRAWIASKFELRPPIGSGQKEEEEFLTGTSSDAISEAAFAQFAFAGEGKLRGLGRNFVEACFTAEELTPASVGERPWAAGHIQIICNEMADPTCSMFIELLSRIGHRRAIKVLNMAVNRSNTTNYRIFGGELVVLLYQDVEILSKVWGGIERITLPRATFVTASPAQQTEPLPGRFADFQHFDISVDNGILAAEGICEAFERRLNDRRADANA